MLKRFPVCALILILIVSLSGVSRAGENIRKGNNRPRIGLVLSGGGAKGFAHIGVLKVLEEEDIPIDYITGTSMGSIVGSLYSLGYSAHDLERFALETDWYGLLRDTTPRRNIPLRDRDEYDKYNLNLEFTAYSVQLPKGLIKGQALESRLSRMMIPYHGVSDYSLLPIPFKCVATDIVTGSAVVMDKGFLPESVRASMSIPSVFTPIEISGHLLVDGGIACNFPVSEVREMGAQFVIGVDVGQPLYKKYEVDSFAKIMEQSMSFFGNESTKKQRKLCDILVLPDIQGISSASFSNVQDIIDRGERAAREKLPEIRALAARMKKYPPDAGPKKPAMAEPKKIHISSIKIEGLSRISNTTVLAMLNIGAHSDVSPEDIDESIRDVYGSSMFDKVTYRIIPGKKGDNTLIIKVKEKDTHLLQIGLSYDTYLNWAALANITFRNMWIFGNKFMVDATIGLNPGLKLSSSYYTGYRPGMSIGVELEVNHFDAHTYTVSGGSLIPGRYKITNMGGRVLYNIEFSNSILLGLGVEKKVMIIDPQTKNTIIDSRDVVETSSLFASAKIDTYDNIYFPKKGIKFNMEARYVMDSLSFGSDYRFPSFMKYTASAGFALPLHKKISFIANVDAGYINSKIVPVSELYFLGGMRSNNKNFIPLPGLNLFEISGTSVYVLSSGISLEPWRGVFLIPRFSAGEAEERLSDLFNRKNILYGAGLTIGIWSFIIPLEFSCIRGWGSRGNRTLWYLNVGYMF